MSVHAFLSQSDEWQCEHCDDTSVTQEKSPWLKTAYWKGPVVLVAIHLTSNFTARCHLSLYTRPLARMIQIIL